MKNLNRISVILFYEPGQSHLDSITIRAEQALEAGFIQAMPEYKVSPGAFEPFWTVELITPPEDKPFWWAFSQGMDFCRNNRPIAVGVQ